MSPAFLASSPIFQTIGRYGRFPQPYLHVCLSGDASHLVGSRAVVLDRLIRSAHFQCDGIRRDWPYFQTAPKRKGAQLPHLQRVTRLS